MVRNQVLVLMQLLCEDFTMHVRAVYQKLYVTVIRTSQAQRLHRRKDPKAYLHTNQNTTIEVGRRMIGSVKQGFIIYYLPKPRS